MKSWLYQHEGKDYPVIVTYKRSHVISGRIRNGAIVVYAPYRTSDKKIDEFIKKFERRLFKVLEKEQGETAEYIYLLGEKRFFINNSLELNEGKTIAFKDKDDLHKKLKKWFLEVVTLRTRYYEKLMNLYENKISVRYMNTRLGSNSINLHKIHYSMEMIHYSIDRIDAIVIHELAHCKHHGHGKDFYECVYKYCPDYQSIIKKIKGGLFHD